MQRLAKAKLLVIRFPFSSQWGGEEVHTIELMKALDKKAYEISFLGSCPELLSAFSKHKFQVQKAYLSKAPVTKKQMLIFMLLSPILFFLAGFYLWRAKRQNIVEIAFMLSLTEKLLMAPWARLFNIKMIWMEHARIGNWLSKNPLRFFYKKFSKWAKVLVTSKAMLPIISKYAHNTSYINCAVFAPKSEAIPKEISNFLKSGFALGSVCRLTIDKGVDMLVRLVHSKPEIRLVIVGQGKLEKTLSKELTHPQIMLVKSLSRAQLMNLYENLDLFILASREMDPFGMVASEAMWHGTPTIVTNVCGISQDLTNGKNALIVEPKFSELDKALKKLIKHKEERLLMGKEAQNFARFHYSPHKMVTEFEKIFRDVNHETPLL